MTTATKTTGNKNVVLEGKGPVTLRDSNYVASGGEGVIYRLGDLVVKIYHEPLEMRQKGMPDKVRLLSSLSHRFVVAPQGLVLGSSGEPVGHFLPFIDGHPLSRMFTNDFWQQEGFNVSHASTLVDGMREVVTFAHNHKATLVDANELNWLAIIQGKKPEPRIIDVDSWSIGRWPATVIMPSIRDWHTKDFGDKTDWFAWGIVTFQIYTGIHPYKGTLDGFARGDLLGRMKANASVFAPGVKLNRAVREFSEIPAPLLEWYEATFQRGSRDVPPSPFDTSIKTPRAARVMRVVATGPSGTLVFEKLHSYPGDRPLRVFHCGAVLMLSGTLFDLSTKRPIIGQVSRTSEVVRVESGWLVADRINGSLSLTYIKDGSLEVQKLDFTMRCERIVLYENRLFVVTEKGLTEIKSRLFGSKAVASAGQTWGAMVNSTKWFSGVGVMDALGAYYVITPFTDSSVAQVRVKELDQFKIVQGKSGNRFVSLVVVDRLGDYHKVELTFSRDYSSYSVWVGDTDGPELNLAILPKGVCATIVKDGELVIFVPTNGQTVPVQDKGIATDMVLSNWGDKVTYIHDGSVWSVSKR